MKNIILLLLLIAFGCKNDDVEPCPTRDLPNDYIEMGSFLIDDKDSVVKMISDDGRIENVNLRRGATTTWLLNRAECWDYRMTWFSMDVQSTFLDFGFKFYVVPTPIGETLLFEQLIANKDYYVFECHLKQDSTIENYYRTYENGKYKKHYLENLTVSKLTTFKTQWKTFSNVLVFQNSILDLDIIPNKAVEIMVIDPLYGVIQFTTKSGETWDIIYD